MSRLFVVEHHHPAECCPATDPTMASMLLKHLSPENAGAQGLTIRSEAVVDNAHALYMIVEAADSQSVERFMQPFAQAGSVSVMPASSCETVVERGGCAV
jgi:hypothetical protein